MPPLGDSNRLDKSDICVDDLHVKHVFKYASKIFKVVFGSQLESEWESKLGSLIRHPCFPPIYMMKVLTFEQPYHMKLFRDIELRLHSRQLNFLRFCKNLCFESFKFSLLSETHSLAIGFQLNKITF